MSRLAEFARLMIERGLHSRDKSQLDWDLRAFSMAAVVSYARAFAETLSAEPWGVTKTLPGSILQSLDAEELSLHERLIERRNQELAHSDLRPVGLELELIDGEPVSMSSVTRVPIDRSEAVLLLSQTTKLLVELTRRREVLQSQLLRNVIF